MLRLEFNGFGLVLAAGVALVALAVKNVKDKEHRNEVEYWREVAKRNEEKSK